MGKAEKREIDPTNIGNHNQFIFLIMHSLHLTIYSQFNIRQERPINYVVIFLCNNGLKASYAIT